MAVNWLIPELVMVRVFQAGREMLLLLVGCLIIAFENTVDFISDCYKI
jgi:hypothetical protein